MKKFLKRFSMIALAALTCFMIIGVSRTEKASTATSAQSSVLVETIPLTNNLDVENLDAIKELEKTDDNFHFISGCKVNLTDVYEGTEPLSTLRFGLELDNEDLLSLGDYDTAYATFTLYRSGETVKPLYRIMIFHAWNLIGMAHSHISGDGETGIVSMQNKLHVAPSQAVGDMVVTDLNNLEEWKQVWPNTHAFVYAQNKIAEFLNGVRDNNYVLDFITVRGERGNINQPIIFEETDGRLQLYFDVVLNSFDAEYFVAFNYEYKIDSAGIFEDGAIKSDARSIGQVLMNMYAAGALETELPTEELQAKGQEIIDKVQGKEAVTVEYLEQIGDSPFAKKVTAEVTVPVLNKTVKKDDVELQIGKNTDCMGSFLESFTYNESRDVYESTYCTSTIGYVKTPTGDTTAIPLSINYSYLSFYQPFVDSGGGISLAEASYIWNTALSNHSEDLKPYSDRKDEVYGLWGYVLIPGGYSASDIWSKILARDAAYDSVWPVYASPTDISTKEYYNLLGGYHQNWWRKTWNALCNWISGDATTATHVFFYADARKSTAVISGNGTTDINNTNSLITNEIPDATKAIAEGLTDAAKNIGNSIKNSSPVRAVKNFFKMIGYGLATIFVVWLILKIFPIMKSAVVGANGGTQAAKPSKGKKKKK